MTDIILRTCQPHVLLSHLALYGLAAILEAEGLSEVRTGWTEDGDPRPSVIAAVPSEMTVGDLIKQHARAAHTHNSWLQRNVEGTQQALMSPRLASFGEDQHTWDRIQRSRHDVLDELTAASRWLDIRFLAALGEPCYWRRNREGKIAQDDAASRLEMQPRNRGSEFVGTRLRKLADAVANRDADQILAGLCGDLIRDEKGGEPDSRTATGLASPGPVDSALAWCALWGISQLPLAVRVNSQARTSGHFENDRHEWFYTPVWHGEWRPARLRSILASEPLRMAAATGLRLHSNTEVSLAWEWLSSRGVVGMVRFPIQNFGRGKALEKRAVNGELLPTGAPT